MPKHSETIFKHPEFVPDTDALLGAGLVCDSGVDVLLNVTHDSHLSAAVFKSEAAEICIIEANITSCPGKQQYATVQDVLDMVIAGVEEGLRLQSRAVGSSKSRADELLELLAAFAEGSKTFTIRITDPLGLSGIDHPEAVYSYPPRSFEDAAEWGLEAPAPCAAEGRKVSGEEAVRCVADLIRRAKRVVAFTGAGVSTESGLVPFRPSGEPSRPPDDAPTVGAGGGSAGGSGSGSGNGSGSGSGSSGGGVEEAADGEDKAATLRKAVWSVFDPSTFSYERFKSDPAARDTIWEIYTYLYAGIKGAQPNAAHTIFGELYRRGKLRSVITQNIDRLHVKGGVPDSSVRELHGRCDSLTCISCGAKGDRDKAHQDVLEGRTTAPSCDICSGPLKVDTVSFGQPLLEGVWSQSEVDVGQSDLFIVMGSGLLVAPANTLPAMALRRGIPVVIINLSSTMYDDYANVCVEAPCGEFMQQVMDELHENGWGVGAEGLGTMNPTPQTHWVPGMASPGTSPLGPGSCHDELACAFRYFL